MLVGQFVNRYAFMYNIILELTENIVILSNVK